MADNVNITEGSGKTIATDDDGTAQHQYVKLEFGGDNTQTKVSSSDPLPVTISGAATGTIGVNIGKIDGTIQVNVGKIDDVVSVRFNTIGGTAGVNLGKVDGTIQVDVGKINDSIAIKNGTLTDITNSIKVHILSTAGTLVVKIDPAGAVFNNAGHTASIFTVSGTTSGVSASGVTLVAPSANYSFKVFAYSIQTTGIISMTPRFTNGAGTSPTDFWRPLITAVETTSTPKGANLAVTPPGFLFATGASTTLALLNDGSLVHYSVSYIKESA